MPSHWTYGDFNDEDDLFQGDIISRSDELIGMLRGVFPYFCDDRYIGFLVTTQSCDLVRRGNKPCNARYISLAVIREVQPLLPELLDELCGTGFRGIYKKESRYVAEQLLVRIINQNEQARGVFYLHPDADAGIATPSVALLRVTFSLRRQHYELLMKARSGRVQGEFANKLGWLSGNLFSRIATPDWEDKEGDANASSKQAKELLRFVTEADGENWVSQDWIKEAKKKNVNLDNLTPRNASSELEPHAPPEPMEVVLERIDALGRELMASQDIKLKLLESDEFLLAVCESTAAALSELSSGQRPAFATALAQDRPFCDSVCQSVASTAKKVFKKTPLGSVDALCDELSNQGGTIKPIRDRVRAVLATVVEADDLSNVGDDLQAARLFSADSIEHLRAIVTAIESEHTERHNRLAGLLRNDSQAKTALRRAAEVFAVSID